jgi:hypothetical protein
MTEKAIGKKVRANAPPAFWLAINAKRPAATFWSISEDKISEVDSLPENAWPILSLDESDWRLPIEKKCTNKQARSAIRRRFGQISRIINRSNAGVIYGRNVYAMPSGYKASPASLLIDRMIDRDAWPNHPFAVGFLLTVPDSHNAILALWAGNAKRDLSIVEVTENAQNVEQIIEAFCRKHSIAVDDSRNLLVFDLATVMNAVSVHRDQLQAYPDYDDWWGIPVKQVWATAALASGIAAVAAAGTAAALVIHGERIDRDYAALLQNTSQSKQAVVDLFKSNLTTVADRASVDYRSLIATASEVYVSGGLASIQATNRISKVRFRIPIDRTGLGANPLINDTTPYALFQAARARKVAGITPNVFVGSAGNEIFYDYTITNHNPGLLDYLDR